MGRGRAMLTVRKIQAFTQGTGSNLTKGTYVGTANRKSRAMTLRQQKRNGKLNYKRGYK